LSPESASVRTRATNTTQFVARGRGLALRASIGVASAHYAPEQLAELLRRADAAMYEAKKGGKSQYRIALPA